MFPHGVNISLLKSTHFSNFGRHISHVLTSFLSAVSSAMYRKLFFPIGGQDAQGCLLCAFMCVCVCVYRKYTILLRAFGECIPRSIFLSLFRVSCHHIRAPHTCCIISQSFSIRRHSKAWLLVGFCK